MSDQAYTFRFDAKRGGWESLSPRLRGNRKRRAARARQRAEALLADERRWARERSEASGGEPGAGESLE